MRGEKRSETDGGRVGLLEGKGEGGGEGGQSCQTHESPGQKWNKC